MASEPTLDPDLEQVLDDIAADPRAKLFVTDPRKLLTGLRDGSIETPATRAGLRPAERHLLEVYRHELAWLMREAYREDLAHRNTSLVNIHTTTDHQTLAERLEQLYHQPDARRVLAHNTTGTAALSRPIRGLGVLATCLRLEQTPVTQTLLACEYRLRHQDKTCIHVLTSTSRIPHDATIHYCLLECLGAVNAQTGHLPDAITAYSRAFGVAITLTPEHALSSKISLMRFYLRLHRLGDAFDAAVWIDEHFDHSAPALLENIRSIRPDMLSPPTIALTQDLIQSCSTASREVLHATLPF